MKRILIIALLTLVAASLALGHTENEQAGHHSTAERQERAARQWQEGSPQSTGLILQADEGERMVRRWGLPMTIKVDPRNGGSQHLVVGTEDLPPGKVIPVHKHPHADEVVLLLQGTVCGHPGRAAPGSDPGHPALHPAGRVGRVGKHRAGG
jgi:quercetin dioxygenase-like cupin family protein